MCGNHRLRNIPENLVAVILRLSSCYQGTLNIIQTSTKGMRPPPEHKAFTHWPLNFFFFSLSQFNFSLVLNLAIPCTLSRFHCIIVFLCMAWVGCGDLHDCVQFICQHIWQNKPKLCWMWGLWSHGSTYSFQCFTLLLKCSALSLWKGFNMSQLGCEGKWWHPFAGTSDKTSVLSQGLDLHWKDSFGVLACVTELWIWVDMNRAFAFTTMFHCFWLSSPSSISQNDILMQLTCHPPNHWHLSLNMNTRCPGD